MYQRLKNILQLIQNYLTQEETYFCPDLWRPS